MAAPISGSSRERGSTASGSRTGGRCVALREAVEIVRKLLAGETSGVAGERFTLEPGTALAYDRARPRCRCWSARGASGPRPGPAPSPTRSRSAARRTPISSPSCDAGSAPGVRIVVGCVTVVDEDGTWARERARAAVAPYLDVVAGLDPTLELRPGQEPPLDRFTIAGTPEEVAAQVIALWEAGADRVELGTPQGRTTPRACGSSASACCRCCGVEVQAARPRRAARRRTPPQRSGAMTRARARAVARRSDAAGRR